MQARPGEGKTAHSCNLVAAAELTDREYNEEVWSLPVRVQTDALEVVGLCNCVGAHLFARVVGWLLVAGVRRPGLRSIRGHATMGSVCVYRTKRCTKPSGYGAIDD